MQAVRTAIRICLGSLIAVTAIAHSTSTGHAGPANVPLGLNPDNPHYFQFRGKPAVLITSGEHYGAVINLDCDHTDRSMELRISLMLAAQGSSNHLISIKT